METTMANSELEEKLINDEFQKLIDAYLASKHRKKVDIITKAFNFAKHAHKGVRRLSGEPYILHPISVAQIVCIEIGLGIKPLGPSTRPRRPTTPIMSGVATTTSNSNQPSF